MSAQLPYFPKYAKDFLTSEAVVRMTAAQVGAYELLLCHSWVNDPPCTLPDDPKYLAVISKLGAAWEEEGKLVREQFEPSEEHPGRIHHPRLLREWLRIFDVYKSRSKGAQLANKHRRNTKPRKDLTLSGQSASVERHAQPRAAGVDQIRSDQIQNTEKNRNGVSPEPGKRPGSAPAAAPLDLMGLELYARDARLCKAWPKLLATWQHAYPGLNIVAEVRKAHAWEVANPAKQKVDRPRFLNTWLGREQDRKGGKGGAADRGHPVPGRPVGESQGADKFDGLEWDRGGKNG